MSVSGEENWHFQPGENDFGLRVMIREDETYDRVETMVRRHYSVRPATPIVLTIIL